MVRFFVVGVAAVLLCGCNAPVRPGAEPTSIGIREVEEDELPELRGNETPVTEEITEGDSLADHGLVPAEPVLGFQYPMPMSQFEIEGIGDDLEKLILTDFKKDLNLYGIYKFDSGSGKPEIVYVFTRTNDGRGFSESESGDGSKSEPYSYEGLVDKMSGVKKTVSPTYNGATYSFPGRKIRFYNGLITADSTLQWYWFALKEGPLSSDLVILKRSKGEFKSKVIDKAQEIWFNEVMSEWRDLTAPDKE